MECAQQQHLQILKCLLSNNIEIFEQNDIRGSPFMTECTQHLHVTPKFISSPPPSKINISPAQSNYRTHVSLVRSMCLAVTERGL